MTYPVFSTELRPTQESESNDTLRTIASGAAEEYKRAVSTGGFLVVKSSYVGEICLDKKPLRHFKSQLEEKLGREIRAIRVGVCARFSSFVTEQLGNLRELPEFKSGETGVILKLS
jgi:hypothetical protein